MKFKEQTKLHKILFLTVLVVFCLDFKISYAESRGIGMKSINSKPVLPIDTGTYRALIIGNNDYSDAGGTWPSLKTAVSDARALKQVLKEQYHFTDVKLMENASRKDVLLALQSLSRRVLTNDSVLVYYAGHGYLDENTNTGYWVPTDAKGHDHTSYLRNSTIRDELMLISSRVRHTLLISDSCFSGSLLRSGVRGIHSNIGTDQYYKKVAMKKSVQIMAAGGVEYVDDDYKSSGHSPFSYFLLNELKSNDRTMLSLSELSTNVEKAVANNVDQVPESGVLHGAGDELGEFVFIKVKVKGIPKDRVKVIVESDMESSRKVIVEDEKGDSNFKTDILPIPTL
ncbi:MAG: caspase family protein [Gammaproteobacteria bacterium]|nr:caspase family protein [Gammaproteobacteria bacterium]